MGTEISAFRTGTGGASLAAKTNPMPTGANCSFTGITTNTTTTVKSGAGVLYAIIVNTTAAGTITVYDNTAASGTKIATLKSSIGEGVYSYMGAAFGTGLTIVTAASSDITVLWN